MLGSSRTDYTIAHKEFDTLGPYTTDNDISHNWKHFKTLGRRQLKSVIIDDKDTFIPHSQYHDCWCPVAASGHVINSHSIELVIPIYSCYNARWINTRGPCYSNGLTLIVSGKSDHTTNKMWDGIEIAYQSPNFNGCTIEIWQWISYFISHLLGIWLFIDFGI